MSSHNEDQQLPKGFWFLVSMFSLSAVLAGLVAKLVTQ